MAKSSISVEQWCVLTTLAGVGVILVIVAARPFGLPSLFDLDSDSIFVVAGHGAGLAGTLAAPIVALRSFNTRRLYRKARELHVQTRLTIPFAAPFAVGFTARALGLVPRAAAYAPSLDNDALLGAQSLADHTAYARDICVAELKRRGLTSEDIDGWMAPADWLTVRRPRDSGRRDLPRNLELASIRKALFRGLQIASAVGLVAFVPLTLIALVTLDRDPAESLEARENIFVMIFVGLSYTFIASLLTRRVDARVLLLRPFGKARMAAALRRFVPRHLGAFCDVWTLSDRHYRPSPVIGAFELVLSGARFFLAPLIRPSFRSASVRSERSYLKIVADLAKFRRRKLRTFYFGGQATNIRTTDDWWKDCIDLLMCSCDAIVMDISRVGGGSTWEISRLASRGLVSRCVFIVDEDHLSGAIETIEGLLPQTVRPPLFVYTKAGRLRDPKAFEAALVSIMGSKDDPPDPLAQPAPVAL